MERNELPLWDRRARLFGIKHYTTDRPPCQDDRAKQYNQMPQNRAKCVSCETKKALKEGGKDLEMTVDNSQEAWNTACKKFPTDFELDTLATKNAGYNVYRSTAEGHYYDYICELGDRLELNLSDGTTINIWIEKYEDYEDEHNVKQSEYEKLLHAGGTRELTYGEAIDKVCEEFGFDPAKVKIVTEIPKFMVNSKRQLKKVGTISRKPIWNASDWNYIRFDCANWFYEMKDGELRKFYC